MPKKSKNIYGKYSKERLQEAVEKYRNGHMTLRQSSVAYNIPRSTISDHALNKISNVTAGKPPVIPAVVEKEMEQKCIEASEMGLGLNKIQLMHKAGQTCKALKIITSFKKGIPSYDWFRGLQCRNPSLTVRKPVKLSSSRALLDKKNVKIISTYWAKLCKRMIFMTQI
ncbi:hypothetical protein KUTeg_018783 [Tegillarca granosa]|uniref:HTH psq-type domain-containing protein n=1 Tax=Tegillarca granosa TaxID=220873 RepID=A0ABQ9EKA1_TEGGR|nr:hypothetical protein KUTeg_018783 [Tegillarca granosa]